MIRRGCRLRLRVMEGTKWIASKLMMQAMECRICFLLQGNRIVSISISNTVSIAINLTPILILTITITIATTIKITTIAIIMS